MTTPLPPLPVRRISLLGGQVDLVTPQAIMSFVGGVVSCGERAIVANHNMHSLYLLRRDPEMAAFYAAADLIEVDSTPLIAWGKLMGKPISRAHRATYLDWREMFWREAVRRNWRVFYLGGAPGVAQSAAAVISARWPGAMIAVRDGYFDLDDPSVVETINAFKPDVLLVGMGMPRQERWILRSFPKLVSGVVLPVGAAFDYEAGVVPTPPRWTGRFGVEWLFRFFAEPERLFRRYFIEPWSLIGPALADVRARIQ